MPKQVVAGALLKCSMGVAPSTLMVIPADQIMCGGLPAATIMDHVPMANILPFGMCQSITNPTVASATTAAMGVLTPMPCIPNTAAPWAPGSTTLLLGNKPALNDTSKCLCTWGGVIEVTNPGQASTDIP